MTPVFRRLLLVGSILFSAVSLLGQTLSDSAFQAVYGRYLEAYSDKAKSDSFYILSRRLQDYYLADGNKKNYYLIKMNEVLYEAEGEHPYKAIELSGKMLEEMEAEGYDDFSMVYAALGTVFQSRGNYVVAEQYFLDAIKAADASDQLTVMGIQSRISFLLMFRNPSRAAQWNEKYSTISLQYPFYRQTYLFMKAVIEFAQGNSTAFGSTLEQYRRYLATHPELDGYGSNTLTAIEQAYKGNYARALAFTDSLESDLDPIATIDLRILLMKMQGNLSQALREEERRSLRVDSLNADLMFDNMNSISTQAGLAAARQSESAARERTYIIGLSLALVIIALLVVWTVHFIRSRRRLRRKNEQLASALSMAEEADKMKTEFVRSVSHEIRTPLNAISGFSELLWQPGIELSEEEKADMIGRVKENVEAITAIVDEMLQMADRGSTEFYPKNDDVKCNQYLSSLLYAYQSKVASGVELRYTTKVINRFTIATSAEGLRRIIDHLLANAVKFTSSGFIELHCRQEGLTLLISVTDTGSGIPPEKRAKIFEQFYKADSFSQGIGLGLTVSRKIAQKLGGDLTLDESYTAGSRFVLSLPVA